MVPLVACRWVSIGIHARNDVQVVDGMRTQNHASNGEISPRTTLGIDLHVHSSASDGEHSPRVVVEHAASLGLEAIALTDHDTVEGCFPAVLAGKKTGVRVIAGCEFSVAAPWGEMHLLAYFLPCENTRLAKFLTDQQAMRGRRACSIVERLADLGIVVNLEDVLAKAKGGVVGRPHIARALVDKGAVFDVSGAFRKYLGAKRPAFVPKTLPALADVTMLVRSMGGVTSAAHLRSRATKATLSGLHSAGVDAVEVVHPAHIEVVANKISSLALETGLLRTGGSDWHGEDSVEVASALLGGGEVPGEWLAEIESLHLERLATL